MRALRAALALLLLACYSSAADAPPAAWRVTQAEVRVTCPLTVGGSFEARTSSLAGTLSVRSPRPPVFDGDLAADLRTLATGIELRDRHLRESYLETGKGAGFETAVLSEIGLGAASVDEVRGRTSFTGTLLLHGVKKPVKGEAEIKREGEAAHVSATFPVTLTEFGIAKPQYLGVGVKDEVQVRVTLVASPAVVAR